MTLWVSGSVSQSYISISEASEQCRVFLEACDVSDTKIKTNTKKIQGQGQGQFSDFRDTIDYS